MAEWQAIAKLRMHTEHTLVQLGSSTTLLGRELRLFRDWSRTSFTVLELPSEKNARDRQKQKKKAKALAAHQPLLSTEPTTMSAPKKKKQKKKSKVKILNLLTYKLHALGDYAHTIHLFGTTDSYSTQVVGHIPFSSFAETLSYIMYW
jgi:hypothetical protein